MYGYPHDRWIKNGPKAQAAPFSTQVSPAHRRRPAVARTMKENGGVAGQISGGDNAVPFSGITNTGACSRTEGLPCISPWLPHEPDGPLSHRASFDVKKMAQRQSVNQSASGLSPDAVAPVRSPELRPDASFPPGVSAPGNDLRSGPAPGRPIKRLSPLTPPASGVENGAKLSS